MLPWVTAWPVLVLCGYPKLDIVFHPGSVLWCIRVQLQTIYKWATIPGITSVLLTMTAIYKVKHLTHVSMSGTHHYVFCCWIT